jgi:hypothetical protein
MSAAEDLIRRVMADIGCPCGGFGVITEMTEMVRGQVLVTWLTVHKGTCGGLAAPERSYLLDAAALDRGDTTLPGIAPTRPRPGSKEGTNR